MKNKIFIWMMSCIIISIMFLIGCGGDYDEGIPKIFGNRGDSFDPGMPGREGNLQIRVYEKDNPDYGISEAQVYLDNTTEEQGQWKTSQEGRTNSNKVTSGNHLLKVTCSGYEDYGPVIILIKAEEETEMEVPMSGGGGDDYEDNDSWDQAYYITDQLNHYYEDPYGEVYDDSISATIHASGDEDWYEIDLGSDGNYIGIGLILGNIPEGYNYDLKLYKNNGGGSYPEVDSSNQGGNTQEQIAYEGSFSDGSYFIHVYPTYTDSYSSEAYSLYILYYNCWW